MHKQSQIVKINDDYQLHISETNAGPTRHHSDTNTIGTHTAAHLKKMLLKLFFFFFNWNKSSPIIYCYLLTSDEQTIGK